MRRPQPEPRPIHRRRRSLRARHRPARPRRSVALTPGLTSRAPAAPRSARSGRSAAEAGAVGSLDAPLRLEHDPPGLEEELEGARAARAVVERRLAPVSDPRVDDALAAPVHQLTNYFPRK